MSVSLIESKNTLINKYTISNPEELRVTVVVHTGSWASAEQGLEGLKGATFDFQHHSQLLESPKEIRHSTLVLKNLPFQLKHDTMMDVLVCFFFFFFSKKKTKKTKKTKKSKSTKTPSRVD